MKGFTSVMALGVLVATMSCSLTTGSGAQESKYLQASPADLQWFKDAKFGVFICWGPCSIAKGEIGWSRKGPRPGVQGGDAQTGVPLEVYDNLYKQFNPTQFDAKAWVQMIKDSGAKYMIFLTRHHDGFSMFDTQVSDYKVTNTPFGRDVTGELAQACHDQGIKIFWYYSQPDWHHPDYRTANHARYIEYLHAQVKELCARYGKIDGLWFDGLGGQAEDWQAEKLFQMIRTLQPGILINNRAGLPGDFDTPEQEIGHFQIDRMWESCMTMSTGWSWLGEEAPVKSLKECLHLLIRCAGGGGNLALDTGPMPNGLIDPRQAENYRDMGAWLKHYGESLYATNGGPYKPGKWGVSTRKGKTIYLHILDWQGENELCLPPLERKIVKCRALIGGDPQFEQTLVALKIRLPAEHHQDIDTVIALDLDRDAGDIRPIATYKSGSLGQDQQSLASSEWSAEYGVSQAFDGDEATRWGAEPGSRSGWIEVDLGQPKMFSRILILEQPWNRVQKFELQVLDGEVWKTFHEGNALGKLDLKLDAPVTGQRVRLNILEATDVPTLWEMQIF